MYLRLKARHADSLPASGTGNREPPGVTELVRALRRRHYTAFDWRHGGPPGPIKFIDVHQLDLAGRQALDGDELSQFMLRRYIRGIRRLLGRDGGAAQYASGPAWDTPCRSRTLAGQAAAIQAFAIAGRVARCQRDYHCVAGISAFAASLSGRGPSANPAEFRDRAWYASALLDFAQVYDAPTFYRSARDNFSLLEAGLPRRRPDSTTYCTMPPAPGLDEAIAMATAARDFGVAESAPEYLRLARDLTVVAADRHSHPEGGWGQAGGDGTPLDIDATIDLVRVADSLRSLDRQTLERISAKGKRALFSPVTALARRPESGLLLIDADIRGFESGCDVLPGISQGARARLSA